MNGLIGYTGFVGSNLHQQHTFDKVYNSKNIEDIKGEHFDLLICAGIRAEKWWANQHEQEDREQIEQLLNLLQTVSANHFILISTVDVYEHPNQVDEETAIHTDTLHPYGKNRYHVEQFVMNQFQRHTIIRLPGLFGQGLKKNFIYDMIHDNCLHLTNSESVFQFYNLAYMWRDIQTALKHKLTLLNMSTEPVSVKEIASYCFHTDFANDNGKSPVFYDMKSIHAELLQGKAGYIYTKQQVLEDIKKYVSQFLSEGGE